GWNWWPGLRSIRVTCISLACASFFAHAMPANPAPTMTTRVVSRTLIQPPPLHAGRQPPCVGPIRPIRHGRTLQGGSSPHLAAPGCLVRDGGRVRHDGAEQQVVQGPAAAVQQDDEKADYPQGSDQQSHRGPDRRPDQRDRVSVLVLYHHPDEHVAERL